jgi:general secretion pathway protein M
MSWKTYLTTPQGRRALFIGVNLFGLLLVYLIFIAPARQAISDGDEAIAERQQTLARFEAVATHEAQIQDYARQVAESNGQGELFDGDSDGVISANLQARLKSIAEGAQVTVRSIQMLPDKTLGGVSLVGARLDVAGSYENLHELARALEGAPPLLIITAASLRGQAQLWGPPSTADQDLEAQFDVFGGAPHKGRR